MKIAKSVHETDFFAEMNLVGVHKPQKPQIEESAPNVRIVRVSRTARRGSFGRLLRGLTWQPRVYLRYRKSSRTVLGTYEVRCPDYASTRLYES